MRTGRHINVYIFQPRREQRPWPRCIDARAKEIVEAHVLDRDVKRLIAPVK